MTGLPSPLISTRVRFACHPKIVLDDYDAVRHSRIAMTYTIKRYANRKLYDTRTKRYLTLEEVGVLVKVGEDIRVEDADSGDDLTATVLAKIIADGNRRGSALLPANALVDLIQRPSEAVFDAVKSSVSAGQRAAEQVGAELGKFVDSVNRRVERDAVKPLVDVSEQIAKVVEERLRALLAEMNVATSADVQTLAARVTALEGASSGAKRNSSRKPATVRIHAKSVPSKSRKTATPKPAATKPRRIT